MCVRLKKRHRVCVSIFKKNFLSGLQMHVCIWCVLCFVCVGVCVVGSNRFIARRGVTRQLWLNWSYHMQAPDCFVYVCVSVWMCVCVYHSKEVTNMHRCAAISVSKKHQNLFFFLLFCKWWFNSQSVTHTGLRLQTCSSEHKIRSSSKKFTHYFPSVFPLHLGFDYDSHGYCDMQARCKHATLHCSNVL